MIDIDATLISPPAPSRGNPRPLLAMTIIWHPDASRIGEQFVDVCESAVIQLNRLSPLFGRPGGAAAAIGQSGITREPLRLVRSAGNALQIIPSASPMVVELNGEEIHGVRTLTADQLESGQILGLGRIILLCLHWMRCVPKNNPVSGFLGVGSAAIMARDQLLQAARTELPVLLLGETGTGKEIAARAIHALSARAARPLVTVNMAALNESLAAADLFGSVRGAYTGAQTARKGLFAEAEGATLFLDEIGNTPATIQPMLLRVLEGGDYRPVGAQQDQQSTARLIAATDQDLDSDHFNQALLRRLESFVMHLPSLRERREDIGVLIAHMIDCHEQNAGMAGKLPFLLLTQFACYDWPGNIRQLAHVVKRTMLALHADVTPFFENFVRGPVQPGATLSRPDMLPGKADGHGVAPQGNAGAAAALRKKPNEVSETEVLFAMEESNWYIQTAAQRLGISRPSMYKLLDAHSQIRRVEQIATSDIELALAQHGGDLDQCASTLKTPNEALRRYLRAQGLDVT